MITYDGKSSNDYHIIVEHYPSYTVPKRSITKVSVPGRNGDLLIDNGNYENVTVEYDIALDGHSVGFAEAFKKAGQFLSTGSYYRLEDSYDDTVYRMAYVSNELEFKNYLHKMGRGTLKFDCMPFRWYKSGETAVSIESGGYINNNYACSSLPLIKVTGTSAGVLTIGSYVVTINQLDDYLYIDCEDENVYRERYENRNSYINRCVYPQLIAGNNTVTFTGGITGVEITPRWRTL